MSKISFWDLLEKHKVVIPIIQRDYAQGRIDKAFIRKSFLEQIKQALTEKKNGELDFVYGTTKNGAFYPLDGQQRLTTLWLIHWFIAYKAGVLKDVKSTLKKFSYETRKSSREFCENLCDFSSQDNAGEKIDSLIQKQTWFYAVWKQDPTIQSMLRMLCGTNKTDEQGRGFVDGIEELFQGRTQENFQALWEELTSEKCPLRFSKLEIESSELPVSDDLYIKMNARGKALTSFENLKADLTDYIKIHPPQDSFVKPDLFVQKMDNEWTDLFWCGYKSSKSTIDEIFFAFINRVFFFELCVDIFNTNTPKDKWSEECKECWSYLNNENCFYQTFSTYRYRESLDTVFEHLATILDFLKVHHQKLDDLIKSPYSETKKFNFIPRYEVENDSTNGNEPKEIEIKDQSGKKVLKVTGLTQVQRIAFFAVCKFIVELPPQTEDWEEERMERWMRVVWNLISVEADDGGDAIRSEEAMLHAMAQINKLESQNIYNSLLNLKCSPDTSKKNTALAAQLREEVEKAGKILDAPQWEKQIVNAEKSAFFKGAIRFLYHNGDGTINWNDFGAKFEHVQQYFNKDGITPEWLKDAELLRCMIRRIAAEDWTLLSQITIDNQITNWRNRILLNQNMVKVVHDWLKELVSPEQNNQNDENAVILSQLRNPDFLKKICEHHANKRVDGFRLHEYKKWRQSDILLGYRLQVFQNCECFTSEQYKDGILWGENIVFMYREHPFIWTVDGSVHLCRWENNSYIREKNFLPYNGPLCKICDQLLQE